MIILLSPAKTFNKEIIYSNKEILFKEKTKHLVNILNKYSKDELKDILKISNSLANNAYSYYSNFNLNIKAISLYGGQAFKYLNYKSLNDLNNLYILSPLYGILNANDAISMYRLDIKDKIIDESLYDYWYQDINNYLMMFNEPIINLSSGEFSRLLNLGNNNITTINFNIFENNRFKSPSMEIKKMRGIFANYLINNNIKDVVDIKNIELENYKLNNELSSDNEFIFTKYL